MPIGENRASRELPRGCALPSSSAGPGNPACSALPHLRPRGLQESGLAASTQCPWAVPQGFGQTLGFGQGWSPGTHSSRGFGAWSPCDEAGGAPVTTGLVGLQANPRFSGQGSEALCSRGHPITSRDIAHLQEDRCLVVKKNYLLLKELGA